MKSCELWNAVNERAYPRIRRAAPDAPEKWIAHGPGREFIYESIGRIDGGLLDGLKYPHH